MEISEVSNSLEGEKETLVQCKNRRNVTDNVWSFLNSAFTKLSISTNDPESIDSIFQLIKDATNKVFIRFLSSSYLIKTDQNYLTDFVLWVIGQFNNIISSQDLKNYRQLCKHCQISLLKDLISKNYGVFNIVACTYVTFIREVLQKYEQYLKDNVIFSVSGFLPSDSMMNISFDEIKVVFITEFIIRDGEVAVELIDTFLLLLESLYQYSCFNPVEIMDFLDHVIELCDGEVQARALRLSVSILPLTISTSSFSPAKINIWLERLLNHCLKSNQALPSFALLLRKIMESRYSNQFCYNQLFQCITFLLVNQFEKRNVLTEDLAEIISVGCLLLDKLSFNASLQESIYHLVPFSELCQDIFLKYLRISVNYMKPTHLRGLKRKRHITTVNQIQYEDRVWVELTFLLLNAIERGPGMKSISYIIFYLQISNALKEAITSTQNLVMSNDLLCVLEIFLKDCFENVGSNHFSLLCEAATLYIKVSQERNEDFMKVFVNYYIMSFEGLLVGADFKTINDGAEKSFHCITELYFYFNKIQRLESITLLWSALQFSLQLKECLVIFKNLLPTLILATSISEIKQKLTKSFTAFLTDKHIERSIREEPWGSQLACLLSNRCFLKRRNNEYKILCADCNSSEFDSNSDECPDINLNQFLKSVEFKYIELLLTVDTNSDLLNHYPSYIRHLNLLKNKQLLMQYLLTGNFTLKHKAFEILSQMELNKNYEINQRVNFQYTLEGILQFMKSQEFWNNDNLMELVFNVINIIAKEDKYCLLCYKLIHLFLIDGRHFGRVRLADALQTLVSKHNTTLTDILHKYKEDFSLILMLLFKINYMNCKRKGMKHSVIHLIDKIKEIYNFSDGKKFLKTFCITYLLPQIIINCNKKMAIKLLVDLADYFNMSLVNLIVTYFEDIYTEFFVEFMMDESNASLLEHLKTIEACSRTSIEVLVSTSFETLISKFILNAGHPKIVCATRFLFQNESYSQCSNLYYKHLLGLLRYIDTCLQSNTASNLTVSKCLKCLPNLIILLGPEYVTKMRFKIFSTLRNGLKLLSNNNPVLYFTSWALFIYSVDLNQMGSSLSSIFVTLLPLLEKLPNQVSNLLYFLVVSNKNIFLPYIPDLYFVQDSSLPKMHQIWTVIQDIMNQNNGSYMEEIEKLLSHIGKEDVELQVHALNRLYSLLRTHSVELHRLIVRSDILHPLVSKIIDCLMATLRTSNGAIRKICATCLGELGAVDPTLIGYKLNQESLNKKLVCLTNTLEFAYVCVSGLVKGLQNAKDLHAYNTFVGATQEVLKIYFKKHGIGLKENFFEKFPTNVREILETLFQARYRHMVPDIRKLNLQHPIFGSEGGLLDWAYHWALQLISFINYQFDVDLFLCCAPCMKIDLDFILLLLPYILLRALVTCSDENKLLIEEEIKTVLHWKVYGSRRRGIIHIWKRIGFCKQHTSSNFVNKGVNSSKYVAIIFDLFDFLYKYATDSKLLLENQEEVNLIHNTAKEFLEKFHHKALFVQSYVQKDYYQSLWHIEKILLTENQTEDTLHQLRNIYSKLNDSDGLIGVMGAFQNTPSTEETVLCNVVRGNLQDALIGYRMLASKYGDSNHFYRGLIQCYLSIDQPSTALQVTKALISTGCPPPAFFGEYTEVLWNMSKMDEIGSLVKKYDVAMRENWCWSVDVGLILSSMDQGKNESALAKISSTRQHLVNMLSFVSYNKQVAYRQGYDCIIKLHILNEMEKFCQVFENELWDDVLGRPMELRLALLQPSERKQVLNIRRIALGLIEEKAKVIMPEVLPSIQKEISNLTMKNIAIARKSGNYDHAFTCISLAERFQPIGLFVEKAKLYRSRLQTDAAVLHLRQGITQYFNVMQHPPTPELQMLYAKAKLLIAQFNVENINVDINDGMKYYKEAVEVYPWEKACVCMAQYLYRIITAEPSHSHNLTSEMELNAAEFFGMSMKYGSQFIYQSMPCMLSLWLDFVARMVKNAGNTALHSLDSESLDSVTNFHTMIDKYLEILPSYMFMTAFSQLISRIGHPYEPCFQLLKKIIVKMIISFPQQACWTFIATLRSPHSVHKKRSMEILKDSTILQNSYISKFLEHFKELVNKLISLCLKDPQKNRIVHVETLVKGLKEFLKNSLEIMVPAQKFRTVILPNLKYSDEDVTLSHNHHPFPENIVYFVGVKKEVEILQSLQMPKKVVFYGSDGREYIIMCKPKDDLRLDSRIMEFNSIVNMYLRREPKTRERNLYIRTYSVVPLSNQCGLIEWIPNLLPLKLITNKIYKKKGIYDHIKEVHSILTNRMLTVEEKRNIFEFLLNQHPPVLQEWLFDQFQNPQTWYLARRSFIRTTAVMSIVGYMEGLGDRHCENILIDSTSADIVHVDFNCVFNKGDTYSFPEMIPFRLTNNIVKAMGPTGYEGTFVRSCEETARVMRKFSDHLMATMKPFLHDPKIFSLREASPNKKKHLEFTNENAKSHIGKVQCRLSGVVRTCVRNTPPLSVEGQVSLLIAEATNVDNLAQMFPGWTAHI